jgi:hypothetical protein
MIAFAHASDARKVKLMSHFFLNESRGQDRRPDVLDCIMATPPAAPAASGWMRAAS